jgi:hypothetical protein
MTKSDKWALIMSVIVVGAVGAMLMYGWFVPAQSATPQHNNRQWEKVERGMSLYRVTKLLDKQGRETASGPFAVMVIGTDTFAGPWFDRQYNYRCGHGYIHFINNHVAYTDYSFTRCGPIDG